MKVVVNPAYHQLTDIIHQLPDRKFTGDSIIREKRNSIYRIEVDGEIYVIKKFKKPTLMNQFVYAFIRKSKAKRAYEYAFRLKDLGVDTPEPVAYIEMKKYGLFHTGYFVSTFLPYASLEDAQNTVNQIPVQENSSMDDSTMHIRKEYMKLLKAFLSFTIRLHEKGVLHYDYNLSNVLYFKQDGSYQFALIDINQMRFGKMSYRQCLRCLKGLGFPLTVMTWFTEQYALHRGNDPMNFTFLLLFRLKVKTIRKSFKRNFRTKVREPLKHLLSRKETAA